MTDGFQESRGFHTIDGRFANDAQIVLFFGGLAAFAFAFKADKCAIGVVSKAIREEQVETGYHAATAHERSNILDLGDTILLLWNQIKSVHFVEH